jgi:DNA polymerase-3 subunit alpha
MGEKFIKQAMDKGYEEEFLKELWSRMETFARYAFNVAHSAAYGLITYRTAWLKAHYPAHFMAATLTNEVESNAKDALESFILAAAEAKKMGISLLAPDINFSDLKFSVVDNKTIRFGITAIKGVGPKAVEEIMQARLAEGKFTSLENFMQRVNQRIINKKVMNVLILGGAFDSINNNRIDLLKCYYAGRAEEVPEEVKIDRECVIPIPESYTFGCQLDFEQSLLGLYVSGHPLETLNLPSWRDAAWKTSVETAGKVIKFNKIKTKKDDDMAFVTIETLEGMLELVIFPKVFAEVGTKIVKGDIVRVKGKKEDDSKVIVNSLTKPRINLDISVRFNTVMTDVLLESGGNNSELNGSELLGERLEGTGTEILP